MKKAREGFANEFTSARSLLGVKKGAENVPFRSPGKEKFKHREAPTSQPSPRFILDKNTREAASGRPKAVAQVSSVTDQEQTTEDVSRIDGLLNDDDAIFEVAIPRRTDWTPKGRHESEADVAESPTPSRARGFADGFVRSFSFEDQTAVDNGNVKKVPPKQTASNKKRVELVAGVPAQSIPKTKKATSKASEKSVTTKRKRSSAKKPMTITGLVTDLYRGKEDSQKDSLIVQYLSATQARTVNDDGGEAVGAEDKIQVSVTNSKPRKRAGTKIKLMSPQSAMKAAEAQEIVFGYASQLAQGDEAASRSPADPFSTQQTQPISIESTTPQTGRGTSRFARVKNLWNISARDEDNALLHIDTVDMCDTPAVRNAFAGKDALYHEGHTNSGTGTVDGSRVDAVVDVDDFESPLIRARPFSISAAASRSFHTDASMETPRKTVSAAAKLDQQPESNVHEVQQATKSKAKAKKAAPKKPLYAGFSTSDLQKQISAFGFKPVKKREKMVELLEMCWEQKHGKPDNVATEDNNPTHGDFLSKVHDISARPQPKVAKPKKRAKDDQSDKSPKKATKRQKKTAPAADGTDPPKRGRPRKSKIPAVTDADVVDIDDTEMAVETASAPAKQTRKASTRVPTPPPSMPVIPKTDIQGDVSTIETDAITSLATPPLSEEKAIGGQIYAAIMKQSEIEMNTQRNHKQNPTWHEKILLFDPIVLEDLTVWLNTEGLGLIGEDREVSTIEVRDWCESKSICCLWKGGWRGNRKTSTED